MLKFDVFYNKKLKAEALPTWIYLKHREPHKAPQDQHPTKPYKVTDPQFTTFNRLAENATFTYLR